MVGHDDQLTKVEEVIATDRHETVYNVRVAEDHTYFVGDEDWGFSVWVHNAYTARQLADGTYEIIDGAGDVVRSGLSQTEAEGLAKLFNNLSDIKRVKPTKIGHAADRAAQYLGLNRADAIKELNQVVKRLKEGIPPGSLVDPGNVLNRTNDSILIPLPNTAAVFEIKPNSTVHLQTVLNPTERATAFQRLGL